MFRQVTELQPAEGTTKLSDMRSATYEDGNGKSFSFDIKTSSDQNPPDVVDGRAERKGPDVLAIKLSKPNEQKVEVDKDVLFPTGHVQHIIAAAKAGPASSERQGVRRLGRRQEGLRHDDHHRAPADRTVG